MTFVSPAKTDAAQVRFFAAPRPAPRAARRRLPGEDGARLAFGGDRGAHPAPMTGAAVEHLARIVLG